MNSIQRRLTVGLALVCTVLWIGGGAVVFAVLRSGLVGEFDHTSQVTAERLANFTEYTQGQIAFDSSGELLPAFEPADRPDYFQVWRPDGSALARSPSLADRDLRVDAGTQMRSRFSNLVLPNGRPGRAAGIRFLPHEDDEAPASSAKRGSGDEVTLVVARDRTELDSRLRQLTTTLFIVGLTTAALTLLLVGVVVRRGLEPLSALAGRAATIDASSLALRFDTDQMPAELLPIGQRLNDLLARLESSFARERRFSADVAHELRTPIAELRTLAEVALKWPDEAEVVNGALRDALAVALQMELIATGLLALARCESGLLPLHPEAVVLKPLVDELWRPHDGQARAKTLYVTFAISRDASCHADPLALRVIVGNLLANAVEYTPAGGRIDLTVAERSGSWRLLISNTTDGVMPEDLPHLFDRFWRKDIARSPSTHSGLGLALAKAYADASQLSLRASITGDGTLCFECSGPRGSE